MYTSPILGFAGGNIDSGEERKTVEEQSKSMRSDLDALRSRKETMQVDEALWNVRCLASRPNLTSPNVLMAALETLIEISNKAYCKDTKMYSKSYTKCRSYEQNEDFCGLVFWFSWRQENC